MISPHLGCMCRSPLVVSILDEVYSHKIAHFGYYNLSNGSRIKHFKFLKGTLPTIIVPFP